MDTNEPKIEPSAEPKRKRGRPPWTEAQKKAASERAAKKRKEKEAEQRRQEREFAKTHKKRVGRDGPWSDEMRASNKATWERKAVERETERQKLWAENPGKTKEELGLPKTWMSPEDEEKKNARYLRTARVSINLPPVDLRSMEQIQERTELYLDFCDSADKVPNLVGLGNWLGVSKITMDHWKRGDYGCTNGHSAYIQRIVAMLEEIWVDRMQENKINPANGIFLAKNLFGYKDQQDVVVTPQVQDERKLSAEDIAKYYLDDGKTVETTFVDEPKVEPKD